MNINKAAGNGRFVLLTVRTRVVILKLLNSKGVENSKVADMSNNF